MATIKIAFFLIVLGLWVLAATRSSSAACPVEGNIGATSAGISAATKIMPSSDADVADRERYLTRSLGQIDAAEKKLKLCDQMALGYADVRRNTSLLETVLAFRYAVMATVASDFSFLSSRTKDRSCAAYLRDLSHFYVSNTYILLTMPQGEPLQPDEQAIADQLVSLVSHYASNLGLSTAEFTQMENASLKDQIQAETVTLSPKCESYISARVANGLLNFGLH